MRNRVIDTDCGAPARLRHPGDGAAEGREATRARPPAPTRHGRTSASASRRRRATRPATSGTATCATGCPPKIDFGKETDSYLFDVKAKNIGYHDQSYAAELREQQAEVHVLLGLHPAELQLPDLDAVGRVAARTSGRSTERARRCRTAAAAPAPVRRCRAASSPSDHGGAGAVAASIYRDLAKPFEMQQRRHRRLQRSATPDQGRRHERRLQEHEEDRLPAVGRVVRLQRRQRAPDAARQPDERLHDGREWANQQGMLRVAYDHSLFYNHQVARRGTTRCARPTTTTGAPPNGPYDPSGYSNGNGAGPGPDGARCPDNTMKLISARASTSCRATRRSTAPFQFTTMKQNDDADSVDDQLGHRKPAVYALFPGLAQLPRATAEAEVKGINALFNFNTRPNNTSASTRYRYNDHENMTPAVRRRGVRPLRRGAGGDRAR